MALNKLGSPSALSLAADPGTLSKVLAEGASIAIMAAVFTYKEYKAYKDKKLREEIKRVNQLHSQYLAKIRIVDLEEVKGFPVIFNLVPGKDETQAESMHLTEEEVKSIGETLPHGSDIALSNYMELILDAIRKLKAYYAIRKNKKDVASGVISYLLFMLESKCLNFQGYDYDIAYLNALGSFINAYASLNDREETQHFSRLSPVFAALQLAKQELEKHKESLYLDEMIGELRDACRHESDKLIRDLTKLIVKNEDDDLVDTVSLSELASGLLRPRYINSEVKGIVLKTDKKKKLPQVIFKKWITQLASYYMQSINPDLVLTQNDVASIEAMFAYPNLDDLKKLKKTVSLGDISTWKEIKKMEKALEKIRTAFELSPNFITTKLVSSSKKFISVTDDSEIIERTKIIADFAALAHRLISLQYLCTHLLRSIKQLGEIYVRNPQNFCTIFIVLDELCSQISSNVSHNKAKISAIQKETAHVMQLKEIQVLPEQFQDRLDAVNAKITNLGERVRQYREKVTKDLKSHKAATQSVKHEMFEVIAFLSGIYGLQANMVVDTFTNFVNPSKQEIEPVSKRMSELTVSLPQIPTIQDETTKCLLQLNASLTDIYHSIFIIKTVEKVTPGIAFYDELYQLLKGLQGHLEKMLKEDNKDAERVDKINHTLTLTVGLCMQVRDFFILDAAERKKEISKIAKVMHNMLADKSNDFLNQHRSAIPKYFYKHWQISLFKTATYTYIKKIHDTCQHLDGAINGQKNKG